LETERKKKKIYRKTQSKLDGEREKVKTKKQKTENSKDGKIETEGER
jgi:hypothetical protein